MVLVCSLPPGSDLGLQPFSLTSYWLCFDWVSLHTAVVAIVAGAPAPARAAWRRLVAWLQVSMFFLTWCELQPSETHLLCWEKCWKLQEKTQLCDVPPRAKVQESNLALGWFVSATGLIIAVFAVCWWWTTRKNIGVVYDYGKSCWENTVRLEGVPIYS